MIVVTDMMVVRVRMGGDSPNVGAFMGGDGFNSPRSQPARVTYSSWVYVQIV